MEKLKRLDDGADEFRLVLNRITFLTMIPRRRCLNWSVEPVTKLAAAREANVDGPIRSYRTPELNVVRLSLYQCSSPLQLISGR